MNALLNGYNSKENKLVKIDNLGKKNSFTNKELTHFYKINTI